MSTTPCDKQGPGKCTPAPSSSDDKSREGQWVGIGLAILLTILIVSWLARTCSNRARRQRALHKFCCRPKPVEKNSSESLTVTEAGQQGSQPPIYYHPSSPPAQQQVSKDSPRPVRQENGHAHMPSDPEDPASVSARNRQPHAVHTLGLKKCRTSSASALSLTLAPIQEDAADPRISSQPRLSSAAEEALATAERPSRSQSHPARLTALPDRHLNGGPHWHLGPGGELEEAANVGDLICKLKQLDETLDEADEEEVTKTGTTSDADGPRRANNEKAERSNFTGFSLGGEELSQSQRQRVTAEIPDTEQSETAMTSAPSVSSQITHHNSASH